MKRISPPSLFGSALALLGASALIGWAGHWPLLLQLVPGGTALVISGAAGFLLAGIALILGASPNLEPRKRLAVIGIGAALLLTALAVVIQSVFDFTLID